MRAPKSPAATSSRNPCASRTGRMNDHEMTKPQNSAKITAITAKALVRISERRLAALTLSRNQRHPVLLPSHQASDARGDLAVEPLLATQ